MSLDVCQWDGWAQSGVPDGSGDQRQCSLGDTRLDYGDRRLPVVQVAHAKDRAHSRTPNEPRRHEDKKTGWVAQVRLPIPLLASLVSY